MSSIKPLLDFIGEHESRGSYNIVWGGIKKEDRPKKMLTKMTIGEVLTWQDSIDRAYQSEAAGKYQIMEDTLRGLYLEAGMNLKSLFDEDGQDRLATTLLRRRGLSKYLAGSMSAETFCNSLAMEWASLPVVTRVVRTVKGKSWTVHPGASYYSGDGLNKSGVSPKPFLAVVRSLREVEATPKPIPPTPEGRPGAGFAATFMAAIVAALAVLGKWAGVW